MATDGVRVVKLGTRDLEFPSHQLQPLSDSNHLLGDIDALRQEFQDKGYLFLRGFHDREEVLQARLAVLKYVQESGDGKLDENHPWQEGVLDERCGRGCIPFMEGRNPITQHEAVRRVIEGPRPYKFFERFLGTKSKTFDFKWLRAVHHEGYTGAHVDNVYMSRGSQHLLTLWTPMGDVPIEMGVLAMCEGSHRLPGFKYFQETYGSLDIEKENLADTGWFTHDPLEISQFGGQWKTADFKAGDVMIFGMRTVHMSTVNTTRFARVSCDTRWQPETDPADPRYVGNFEMGLRFGLHALNKKVEDRPDMQFFRSKWGFNET